MRGIAWLCPVRYAGVEMARAWRGAAGWEEPA